MPLYQALHSVTPPAGDLVICRKGHGVMTGEANQGLKSRIVAIHGVLRDNHSPGVARQSATNRRYLVIIDPPVMRAASIIGESRGEMCAA